MVYVKVRGMSDRTENVANWFEVSKDGLKKLQLGKPKHYAIRELLQNAMDEEVTRIEVKSSYDKGLAEFTIIDNSPIGFRDITDAYTLFKPTYKQVDPQKRGRFNLGEKQAFAICEEAKVKTTKGTIIFDKKGRHTSNQKTEVGTEVSVTIKMSKSEYDSILNEISRYIMPNGVQYIINGNEIPHKQPKDTFKAKLLTEFEKDGIMRQAERETVVEIYEEPDRKMLYEMGIPVVDIDCDYSLNVQQRVPLGVDRETVRPIFLKELYVELLKHTAEYLPEESSGATWVRTGLTLTDRMDKETVETVIKKRYGDKVLVANPSDPRSIDDAIAHGYHVIRGSEMSKEEWATVKAFDTLQSTSELFEYKAKDVPSITELTPDMQALKDLTIRIAKEVFGISVSVDFFKDSRMVTAQYDQLTKTVSFNIAKVDTKQPFRVETIAVIFHELAHEFGNHTEESYHEALSKACAKLWLDYAK